MKSSYWFTIFLFAATGTQNVCSEIPFHQPIDIANGSISGLSCMDAGDIDGDGLIDIIALEGGKHAEGRKTFAWFKSPKDAQQHWQRYNIKHNAPLRSFLGSAKLADMDNDGDTDLVVSSDNHSGEKMEAEIFVFLNPLPNNQPTKQWDWYQCHDKTLPLHHINDMEISDMDHDGKLDIIVRSLEPNQVHIFFQNDALPYTQKVIDTTLSQSEGLAVGDLDQDGLPDITCTGYWFDSPSNPRKDNYTKRAVDAIYHTVNLNTKEAVGDIDGDGDLDLLLAPAEAYRKGQNHELAWYQNPGRNSNNQWKKTIIKADTNNHHTIKLADIDNDHDLDVITGVPWGDKHVQIYFNNGSGKFNTSQTVFQGNGLYSGVIADLENDGDPDIIGQDVYAQTGKPWIYINDSD